MKKNIALVFALLIAASAFAGNKPKKCSREEMGIHGNAIYVLEFTYNLPGGKKGDIGQFVQNIDYAPTFLELAGAPVPDDIQGQSLLPLLEGKHPKRWRDALYYHYYEYPAEHAVRRHYGVRTDRYKLIHFYPALLDGAKETPRQAQADSIDCWELYDLKKDPHELRNIYGEKGTGHITKRLQKKLHELQLQYGAPELSWK